MRAATRVPLCEWSEHGGELRAMLGSLEVEERVRRQEMFGDDGVLANIDSGIDLGFGVRLDRDRDAVGPFSVDEQLQRHDAVVDDATRSVPEERTREVGLLMPELRRTRQLGQQVTEHLVA